jgi:hypothetical protein
MKLPKRITVDFEYGGRAYRLRGRKCGKAECVCNTGKLHGPYWYADGKYVGSELPVWLLADLQYKNDNQQQIIKKEARLQKEIYKLSKALEVAKGKQGTLRNFRHGLYFEVSELLEAGVKLPSQEAMKE